MRSSKISLCVLLYAIVIIRKADANSAACEQKEKNTAALDFAKEAITKAKGLQPTCVDNGQSKSSNASECGVKEKVSGYLDIAMTLIDEARKNYSACSEIRYITKEVVIFKKPIDCSEILERGDNESGIYTIWPKHSVFKGKPLKVYCDMKTGRGGWTVIQRRGVFSNKIDFYRNWQDYKLGFGNLNEEFWMGNDNIYALTNQGNYMARFDMKKVNKEYKYATYSSLRIENEAAGYKLHFGNYTGTAGNGIYPSNGYKFSTKDKRNDHSKEPCTDSKQGGWWYTDCGQSNPNGINLPGGKGDMKYMNWKPLTEYESLLSIEIKIRDARK